MIVRGCPLLITNDSWFVNEILIHLQKIFHETTTYLLAIDTWWSNRIKYFSNLTQCKPVLQRPKKLQKTNAFFPSANHMFKVNNKNTRCEICSTLTIKTPEWRQWRHSGVFIVNFEHVSHLVLVFLLLTLSRQMPAGSFWCFQGV